MSFHWTNVLALQQSETYKHHQPETTLLYQLVERHSPAFNTHLADQGKYLPKYVEREFDEFLRCGRLEHGFLRVVCGDCKHEKLVAFSCKRRCFCPSCGASYFQAHCEHCKLTRYTKLKQFDILTNRSNQKDNCNQG